MENEKVCSSCGKRLVGKGITFFKCPQCGVTEIGRCSNCRDQIMKRLPKYYKDLKYEVKYLWQVVAEALVIEPWAEEEAARAAELASAQWAAFGIDPEQGL